MRAFSEAYLRRTRAGMWADSRDALADLELASRERILDVGCGSGELTRVLAEESSGTVIGCDVDRSLLEYTRGSTENDIEASSKPSVSVVQGDATRLPFATDSVDLLTCQALLINLPDPVTAVEEFVRVSSDLVAAIEPDNGAVTIDSTVPQEATLEHRARNAYLEGVETDVTLGVSARDVFETAGLDVLSTHRYDHDRTISPPYDEHALTVARRKATGAGLADDRATMLQSDLTGAEYDDLRSEWRAMGRDVIEAMQDGRYERTETVPFYVTVGRVQP
ncbi:class I SAM-dependent methyltransferase [Halobacteria archaeon AArc-curdl1]|uniref:Class I SAM-dependent methyltransferase n=1 Tax=Natronosalvus hydrolyticus TaxID=2979988 RepID=A0AAP3E8J2_9EURY|nr:class I SAM-dependent methyltransferase [Halobacteria archaeon AArc-curdl1]